MGRLSMRNLSRILLFSAALFLTGTALRAQSVTVPSIQKIQSITQEETEPVTVFVGASGIEPNSTWQLVGTDSTGKSVAVTSVSSDFLGDDSWRIVFPGMPQGTYYVHVTGLTGNQGVLPDALVVTDHTPILANLTPSKVDAKTPFTLELLGRFIEPEAKVELIPDKGTPLIGSLKVKDDSKPVKSFVLSFPGAEPGSYNLEVTSARGKTAQWPGALQVLMPAPVVSGLVVLGTVKTASVTGSNWTPGMKAFLSLEGRRQELAVSEQTEKTLSISYPENLAPGNYDLVVVNNQGKEGILKSAVVVEAPKKLEAGKAKPAYWAEAGVTEKLLPQVSIGFSIADQPGIESGLEAGITYAWTGAPDDAGEGRLLWIDQWMGYAFVPPGGGGLFLLRVPYGISFSVGGESVAFFAGLDLRFPLVQHWSLEVGGGYVSDSSFPSLSHVGLFWTF